MLVGLSGLKGSGKDTVGQVLVKHYSFERMAFADKLKEAVAALFDIPLEKVDEWKDPDSYMYVDVCNLNDAPVNLTWREFLQRFGTEMGRQVFGTDFWVDLLLPVSPVGNSVHLYAHRNIVVTDVRFPNEWNRIKDLGGYNIHILRHGLESDGHPSEQQPDPVWIDQVVNNNGTFVDLDLEVVRVMNLIYGNERTAARNV